GDGVAAIGFEDANGPRRADTVGLQEHHDLADYLLVGPTARDALRPHGTDAIHGGQPFGLLLDDIEDALSERMNTPFHECGSHALDQSRSEVSLDALDRTRRCRSQERRSELKTVVTARLPATACSDIFTRRDRGGGTDQRDQIPVAANLEPEDAKAVIRVVI